MPDLYQGNIYELYGTFQINQWWAAWFVAHYWRRMEQLMKALTRSDYEILSFLKSNKYVTKLESATLQEIMQITKNSRPTTYRKMMNLYEQKYVGKGCKAVNADTFYLLEKGKLLVEGKTDIPIQQRKNNTYVAYDSDSVRDKLINIMDCGLMLKSIAVNAGISESELSRFKNGVDALKQSDVKLLAEYLQATVIPVWNITKEPEIQMSMRERLLASKNKSEMTMRERILASQYRSEEEKKESTKLDALRNLMK